MKRLFSLLLAAALLYALAAPALADAAYMPRDNFIEKHWEDCRYENRWYYTNGADGYVLAHKTPDSAEATPLPNGGKYYISNVYKGEWGVLEYDKTTLENSMINGSVSGWVKMSDLVADYDNDAFMADHASELRQAEVELELTTKTESQDIYAYKYPGSGEVIYTLKSGWYGDGTLLFNQLFTDPAGRVWGYCGYHYGYRNFWICIDDPHNGALPQDENCVTIVTRPAAGAPTEEPAETAEPTPAPAPTATPAPAGKTVELTPAADDATLKQAAKANRGGGPWLIASGVGVVIVAATVLVAALRKKKQ